MAMNSSRIKVLIVLPSLHQGGVERQVSYLFRHLNRDLFEVHLAYFKDRDIFYKQLASDPNSHRVGSGKKTSFDTFWGLYRLVKDLKPQVLHLYTESANQLGAAVSFLTKVPVVLFAVRTTELAARDHHLYRFIKGRAALTLVNSKGIREELMTRSSFRGEEIRVLPNFLDTGIFHPFSAEQKRKAREALNLKPDGLLLANLGRISYQKNQHGAVRALKRLKEEGHLPKNLKLLFVGKRYEAAYDDELKHLIQKEALEEWCEIREPIEDTVALYNALDGLFQTTRFEGLSNVVIEALSCGTPVALSREGDNDGLIEPGKTGVSFSIASEEETARGLKELIDLCQDPVEREKASAAARQSALQRFSVNEGVREVEKIYQSLLKGEPCVESSVPLMPEK